MSWILFAGFWKQVSAKFVFTPWIVSCHWSLLLGWNWNIDYPYLLECSSIVQSLVSFSIAQSLHVYIAQTILFSIFLHVLCSVFLSFVQLVLSFENFFSNLNNVLSCMSRIISMIGTCWSICLAFSYRFNHPTSCVKLYYQEQTSIFCIAFVSALVQLLLKSKYWIRMEETCRCYKW